MIILYTLFIRMFYLIILFVLLSKEIQVQKDQPSQIENIWWGGFSIREFPENYHLKWVNTTPTSKTSVSEFCLPHFWNKINSRWNTFKVDKNSKKNYQKLCNVFFTIIQYQYCLRLFFNFSYESCIYSSVCTKHVLLIILSCTSFCFLTTLKGCTSNWTELWNLSWCGRFSGIFS